MQKTFVINPDKIIIEFITGLDNKRNRKNKKNIKFCSFARNLT